MPTAATSHKGPQAVAPYNYPRGDHDGSEYEWIHRYARVIDDNPTPNAHHTLEVTDGKGGLPIPEQPSKICTGIGGIVQYHTKFTLLFKRRLGQTGPYQMSTPMLMPPPGAGHPYTVAL